MRRSYVVALGTLLVFLVAIVVKASLKTPGEPAKLAFTLKDMNGKSVRLEDFKGKALLVNFWATWCGPCILETPELVDLQAKYKDRGLQIIGISIDDTAEQIQAFAKEYKVNYPLLVGVDHDDLVEAFQLPAGIPFTVFIRADGTILDRVQGINTSAFLEKRIQALF